MQFTFADIVDVPGVQKLMDQHWRATGIPSAIVDIDGNVLVESGWQSICTMFHRQHPETASRCRESDNYLTRRLQDGIP
ncbi:MAG TPA: PocR ligand-binding domain-containing protein, partial [Desulfurivibrionaceae bacterium]|nr:PocR ligand-binding domain-containing protein [Desulfurivibrionaceae bacterium]